MKIVQVAASPRFDAGLCFVRGCFLFVLLFLKHDTCVCVRLCLEREKPFLFMYMNLYRKYTISIISYFYFVAHVCDERAGK